MSIRTAFVKMMPNQVAPILAMKIF